MLYKYSAILLLFFIGFNAYSQEDTIVNTQIIDQELVEFAPRKSTFYIAGQFFNANRTFEDLSVNQKFDSLNSQESASTGGIELGFHLKLSPTFFLSVGANYFGGGETWQFTDAESDSSFNYTNKYRQIAVPIRLNAQFGNKFKGFGFVGLIPSSILTRRFESSFTDEFGVETVNDIETTEENISSFQFAGVVGGGVSYSFGNAAIYAQVEYRQHFTNTYTGLFLDHRQNLLGGSIGLTFDF